jgi:hypothetical protein
MRKPELNRDYRLIRSYKCWHCDFFSGFTSKITSHIKETHPETLK